MISKRKVHHPNDVTNVYFTEAIPKILQKYFRLPGKFVKNYTTRIVKRDGSEGEMDWLFLVEPDNCRLFEKILINVEFQSSYVSVKKIKQISEYKDYAKVYYGLPVLSVIIITDGYELSETEYSRVSSDILRPIYIRMTWEEITKRLKNIENKIENHEKLSEDDALDMVYLPMFAPKNEAKLIIEKIIHLYKIDKSLKSSFKKHISFGLSMMVKKYFGPTSKTEELLKMLEENIENSRSSQMIVDFELDFQRQLFERKLAEKEEELNSKNEEIKAINSQKDEEIEIINSQKDEEIKAINSQKDEEIKAINSQKEEALNEVKFLRKKLHAHGIPY